MTDAPDSITLLETELDKAALELTKDLYDAELASAEKTARFKALGNYYALRMKIDPPNDVDSAFDHWRQINGATAATEGNGLIGQASPARRPRKQ